METKEEKVLNDIATNYYEVLWYLDEKDKEKYDWREFAYKKAMHNYYEKHKKDKGKFNWELSYRNKFGELLKIISPDDTDYDPTDNYDKDDERGIYSYNLFGNKDMGEFYELDEVIKMIDLAIDGKIR